MKKIILIAVILMAFISCTDDAHYKDKCYRVNYTLSNGHAMECYEWISEHDKECQKALFESYKYTDIKYTRIYKYKTIGDCIAQDTMTQTMMKKCN